MKTSVSMMISIGIFCVWNTLDRLLYSKDLSNDEWYLKRLNPEYCNYYD